MFSSGGIALPYLNPQANTIDELEPLAFFGEDPGAREVSNASGIKSLKEFVEHARANPGKKGAKWQRSTGWLVISCDCPV